MEPLEHGAENRDQAAPSARSRELLQLLTRRRKYRLYAEQIMRGVDELTPMRTDDPEHESKFYELKAQVERLTLYKERLLTVQDELDGFSETEDDDSSSDWDCRLALTRDRGNIKLELMKRAFPAYRLLESGGDSRRYSTNVMAEDEYGAIGRRLPRRNLPILNVVKYDGDPLQWAAFWSRFRNDVDSNPELDDSTKLSYLMQALEPHLVTEIKPIGENYGLAVQYLRNKCGDPDQVICLVVQELSDRRPSGDENNVTEMRDLCNFLRARLSTLDQFGMATQAYYPLITSLLPAPTFVKYRMDFPAERSVDHIMEYYKRLVKTMEAAAVTRRRYEDGSQRGVGERRALLAIEGPKPPTRRPSTVMLSIAPAEGTEVDTTNEERAVPPRPCLLCRSTEHQSWGCTSALTLVERKDVLRSLNRCFVCFRLGHMARECRAYFRPCRFCNNARHVAALCPVKLRQTTEPQIATPTVTGATIASAGSRFVLKTMILVAGEGERKCEVVCLVDDGSQRSFVSNRVANVLQLIPRGRERLTASTFEGVRKPKLYEKVKVKLSSAVNPTGVVLPLLIMTNKVHYEAPTCDDAEHWVDALRFEGLIAAKQFSENPSCAIDIILGIDAYHIVMTGEVKNLTKNVTAFRTVFGWTLQGALNVPMRDHETIDTKVVNCVCSLSLEQDESETKEIDVKRLWDLEVVGVSGSNVVETEDEMWRRRFLDTLRVNPQSGRYVVGLPWIDEKKRELEHNRVTAVSRVFQLRRFLQRKPGAIEEYHAAISRYVEDGHAEEVMVEEPNDGVYYIPHRPVYSDSRSTKLRVVFDASSSRGDSPSLNECVHPGIDRSLDLVRLILRFRQGRYSFVGDLRKAFLQIEVRPEDRDFLRYLWPDPETPSVMKIFRMTRVLFGLSASPYLFREVLREHARRYQDEFPLAFLVVMLMLYVDDLVASVDGVEERERTIAEVGQLLIKAGFELHKIVRSGDVGDDVKVLGVEWLTNADELRFTPFLDVPEKIEWTKRTVIQVVSRVFDPMGVLAPITIQSKMFFQQLWVKKYGWDDVLEESLQDEWRAWVRKVNAMCPVTLPRYLGGQIGPEKTNATNELHIFSDASPQAFGAVAYLVRVEDSKKPIVNFLMSRFRVAPVREITLPRLELLGVLLAARLKKYITETLQYSIERVFMWTDSTITLFWVNSLKPKFDTFVSNRVNEIKDLTSVLDWRHCPGDENPADAATKDVKN